MRLKAKLYFYVLIISINVTCYGADEDDIDIMHEIARSTIERDLVESGRYELFKSILEIYHFALDTNDRMSGPPLHKDQPEPVPVQGAGLEVYVVIDGNPKYLCMHWGKLDIDAGVDSIGLTRLIRDLFFEKLTLTFESHEAEETYRGHNRKVDPSTPVVFYGSGRNGLFKIPERDLKNYRETSTLVTSNVNENLSCYKIKAINDKPLPVQKERPEEKVRSAHDISSEWNLLNIMHSRELQIKEQRKVMRAKQLLLDQENEYQ